MGNLVSQGKVLIVDDEPVVTEVVSRYLGLSEKDTLRSWTVMETLISVVGIIVVFFISLFI